MTSPGPSPEPLDPIVEDIEAALVAQWSHFGDWPKGRLQADAEMVRFETPIAHLPYNGVVRTRLPEEGADARIDEVLAGFRNRGVQCFWAHHPSATPVDLGERLLARGLQPVETMRCMSLELADWAPPAATPGAMVEEVVTPGQLEVYTDLTLRYWEIPGADGELVREIHRHWGPGTTPGVRLVARIDGVPVGKAYSLLDGPPGVASIYGMSVVPEARGHGVARELTTELLRRAKAHGATRVVLHATGMAQELYRRAGFEHRCEIHVYATAQLWSGTH